MHSIWEAAWLGVKRNEWEDFFSLFALPAPEYLLPFGHCSTGSHAGRDDYGILKFLSSIFPSTCQEVKLQRRNVGYFLAKKKKKKTGVA